MVVEKEIGKMKRDSSLPSLEYKAPMSKQKPEKKNEETGNPPSYERNQGFSCVYKIYNGATGRWVGDKKQDDHNK